MSRYWENWDAPGIADTIQNIWKNSPGEILHREQLCEFISSRFLPHASSIVEVGCGTGLIYEQLLAKSPAKQIPYTGIDSSLEMLRIARASFPEGCFLYGDGYELVYRDREIDLVLCLEVLGHLPDIHSILSEILRITRQTCIFTVWITPGDAVVEEREIINDKIFLHREYPKAFIDTYLARHGNLIETVEMHDLPSGVKAYVVQMRA
jgi:ubiquinone/menaquinone biosynthesis C-methylase UbiE